MAFRLAPLSQGPLAKAPEKRKTAWGVRSREHLAFLHRLECCVTGTTNDLTVQHIMAGRESYGKKEDDNWTVPLARSLHLHDYPDSLEKLGERNFWNRHGIDALALARDLWTLRETHGPLSAAGHEIIRAHRMIAQIRVRQGIKVFDPKFNGNVERRNER